MKKALTKVCLVAVLLLPPTAAGCGLLREVAQEQAQLDVLNTTLTELSISDPTRDEVLQQIKALELSLYKKRERIGIYQTVVETAVGLSKPLWIALGLPFVGNALTALVGFAFTPGKRT